MSAVVISFLLLLVERLDPMLARRISVGGPNIFDSTQNHFSYHVIFIVHRGRGSSSTLHFKKVIIPMQMAEAPTKVNIVILHSFDNTPR